MDKEKEVVLSGEHSERGSFEPGSFSTKMPERLKKQLEELKNTEEYKKYLENRK